MTDLENLAFRLKGVDPSKVLFETIPQRGLQDSDTDLGTIVDLQGVPTLTPTGQTESVGSVQILDETGFNAMIDQLKGQSPTATSSGATPSPQPNQLAQVYVDPSTIGVTVEDGVGRIGLAAQVTNALSNQGYVTGAPGPAPRTGYAKSEVLYTPGSATALAAAQTLAATVPGSVLKADSSVTSGVVLIVGANYRYVLPVVVSASPSPSPSASSTPSPTPTLTPTASPSPSAKPVTAANNTCTL